MRSEQKKKIREVKFGIIAQDASLQYIGTAQVYPSLILQQISLTLYGDEQFTTFCLFARTLPINFALLGRKLKDDSKIKRQTNLERRGPRPIPIICHLPDPFFLVTDYL
jgi:hypothetical protein